MPAAERPIQVYGSEFSYFTGKLEAYLRYKGIAYERVAMTAQHFNRTVPRATGAAQMPAVLLVDGRWMTDTTPILEWFETQRPEPPILPPDPLQTFASHLLEDYADEWLWRPAMHYRWSYRADALLLSRRLADELLPEVRAPGCVKRWAMRRRQFGGFVAGDGVGEATRAHVEGIYLRTLASLEAIVAARPFLLGDAPTLADFGFFGSMFRHFALDPTAGGIMRERAPRVFAWVGRTWNARGSGAAVRLENGIPDDWTPLLRDVGDAYLPYLCANAIAWREGRKHFDSAIQGARYTGARTSRYRVWCLEQLQRRFRALDGAVRDAAQALLERHGCWEPLWRIESPDSGYDPEGRAPFARGLAVF